MTKVDDVARVENKHDFFKNRTHFVKHFELVVGKVVTAFFEFLFSVLACRSAYDDESDVGFFLSLFDEVYIERHFLETERPMSPESLVGDVLCAPLVVRRHNVGVYIYVFLIFEPNGKSIFVGRFHVAARTVPHAKPVDLRATEHRDVIFALYRQNAVVFQQNNTLCGKRASGILHSF